MAAPRPTTETDRVNEALALIGEPPIASIDDPRRKAARNAKRFFAGVRDDLLRQTPWEFAMAWVTPPAAPNAPSSGYAFRYLMPDDCVDVFQIKNLPDDAWETPNAGDDDTVVTVLDTNATAPLVQYTRRIVNPAQWDESFAVLFALKLAAKLNPLVGRDKTLTQQLDAKAEMKLDEASRRDAQARSSQQVTRDTSWTQARRGLFSGPLYGRDPFS